MIDKKAVQLMRELEKLNLIKVIKENVGSMKSGLSEKYKGIITVEEGKKLKEHIKQMRSEWNNNI